MPATPTLSLQGAVGQSADLVQLKNSTGTVLLAVNNAGQIAPSAVASVGLVIKGLASQSGDLLQVQNSGGTVMASFSSAGNLVFTQAGANITTPASGRLNIGGAVYGTGFFGTINTNGESGSAYAIDARGNTATGNFGVRIRGGNAANVGLVIQGETSQTGDLQRWNTSSGILTTVTNQGAINFASGNTSSTATIGAITAPVMVAGYITMQVAGTTVKVPYFNN